MDNKTKNKTLCKIVKNIKVKKVVAFFTFIFFFILAVTLSSCKSSFPIAGTLVECKGQFLTPILNPTQRPQFNGGKQAMLDFFRKNLAPHQEDIRGKIRVAFVVTKEGEICDIRVTSKSKEHLNNEVIRVIKIMPKWLPGVDKEKIVDSYVLLDLQL